jgi:uncharacterized damage-inducible protein DinB
MPTPTAAEIRDASRQRSAADHVGTIRSFYPFWDVQYRPFLLKAVEAFPASGLDFKPRPEMLTARQMIVHIAEAEYSWTHNIMEGEPYQEWVVPHSDPAQGWDLAIEAPDHAGLLELLAKYHEHTQRWLERPAAEISREIRYEPVDGPKRRYSLHWILDHVQEHEIHHRAQLNMYLRLMGIEPPSI